MKIAIRNFQGLKSVDVEVEGLTVIEGPSNRGKSALIRATAGALFNRPGSSFVRKGEKVATVELTDVPAREGPPLHVVWEKGAGVNLFTVNGQDYSSVGRDAPEVLTAAGYRDLTLDKRDAIRPQIAGQFQGPFLLDAPGSVVSEVLTRASRLDVLLRAGAACTRDLRSARQLLGLRRTDHEKAKKALDAIEGPITALSERVSALVARRGQMHLLEGRVSQLRALTARRQRLLAARGALVPRTSVDMRSAEAVGQLRSLCRIRAAALRARAVPFRGLVNRQELVVKAFQKANRGITLKRLIAARQRLQVSCTLKPRDEAFTGAHWLAKDAQADVAKVQTLRDASRRRRRLQSVPALVSRVHVIDVQTPSAMVAQLRTLVVQQAAGIETMRRSEGIVNALLQEHELAQTAVQNILTELKVCPVCERPT